MVDQTILISDLVLSVESIDDTIGGDVSVEKELTFYAQLKDLNDLKMADRSEKQEQWKLNMGDEGQNARIRATDDCDYVLTTKRHKNKLESIETNCPISKDMFDSLKRYSDKGFLKRRYFFNVTSEKGDPFTWEFDVFYLNGGEQDTWVKIDLEYDKDDQSPPDLPIDIVEDSLIWADSPNLDEQELKWIDTLWNERWQPVGDAVISIHEETENYDIDIEVSA